MLDILEAQSIDLGPTLTYAKRDCCWIPVRKGEPHESSEHGRLLVKQQVARGYGCKVDADTYAVEEQPCIGRMGRAFLLVNMSDDEQEQPYEVFIGRPMNRCTCKAAKCKVTEPCKHLAAMSYIVANQLIGAAS